MLDVRLEEVIVDGEGLRLEVNFLLVPASSHFALAGRSRSGKSLLLRAISGREALSGKIFLGTREATALKPSARPLLHTAFDARVPERWSVQRSLLNALHQRKLDRDERFAELTESAAKWNLAGVLDRRIGDLASGDRLRARLARIEILRPAILLAERLFEEASPLERNSVIDLFFRSMRMAGATLITEPAHTEELAYADRVVVLEAGRIQRVASAKELSESPHSVVEAEAAGEINTVPARARDGTVSTPIGDFAIEGAEGDGQLLVRPESLRIAQRGEESDFIVTVDEAVFRGRRWFVTAYLSGGTPIHLELAAGETITRGRPIPVVVDRTAVRFVSS